MKKYISPILSIILGILTFGMYAAPFFLVTTSGLGIDVTESVGMTYDFIRFDTEVASVTAFSVMSIALLVLAGLLIVSGIFMILQNCEVIKSKSMEKINAFLLVLNALIAISAMICYVVFYAVDMKDVLSVMKIGSTAITIAVVSIAFAVASILLMVKSKSKKRK